MAKAKSFSVEEPNSNMNKTGISEVNVVFKERMNTWLMEWLAMVINVTFADVSCMLSFTRWNTTTVSYSE